MCGIQQRLATPHPPLWTLYHVVLPGRAPIDRDLWLLGPLVTNYLTAAPLSKKTPQTPLCLYIK